MEEQKRDLVKQQVLHNLLHNLFVGAQLGKIRNKYTPIELRSINQSIVHIARFLGFHITRQKPINPLKQMLRLPRKLATIPETWEEEQAEAIELERAEMVQKLIHNLIADVLICLDL